MSPVFQLDKGGLPIWCLDGAVCWYPLTVRQGGNDWVIRVGARPPTSVEWTTARAKVPFRLRTDGDRTSPVVPDTAPLRSLARALYLDLQGVVAQGDSEPTADEKRGFFDGWGDIQERVILEGIEGVRQDEDDMLATSRGLVIPSLAQPVTVRVRQDVWVDGFGDASWRGAFVLRRPSEAEAHRARAADRPYQSARRQEWVQDRDLPALIALFQSLVLSAPGYQMAGEPCSEGNKADWATKIPAPHSILVMDQVLDRKRLGN